MKQVRQLIDFLLYSNIFIGVCAVALAFTNQLTIEGDFRFDYSCWFVFTATVFTYSYLKFRNADNNPVTVHQNWAAQNSQLSKNILLLSLIASACFFWLLNTNTKIVVLALAVVTALYGFVEIPFVKSKKKLRDFGWLKIFFVALVWSVTTVVVPLQNSFVEPVMMVFLLLRRFLFILALTLVFEIKDLQSDSASNLETLPMVLGIQNTKLLGQGILFVMMLINLIQYFFFDISLMNMLAVNLSLLVSIVCIQPLKEETTAGWYYFVLDGMMILQFVFVFMATKYL